MTGPDRRIRVRRRQFITGVTGVGATVVAGCMDSGTNPPDADTQEDIDPELHIGNTALHPSFPIEIVDPESGDLLVSVHWHGDFSHWHFGPLEIPHNGLRSVRVQFNDRSYEALELGPDEPFQQSILRTEDTPEDLVSIAVERDIVEIRGTESGEGTLLCRLEYADEDEWMSPPLPIVVA